MKVPTVKPPTIVEVKKAVSDFLQKALDEVHRVIVTKLVQIDPEEGTWEAEVEVWYPNPTIRALGLPTQKTVLDREIYLLRLGRQLNVLAYGPMESVVDRG